MVFKFDNKSIDRRIVGDIEPLDTDSGIVVRVVGQLRCLGRVAARRYYMPTAACELTRERQSDSAVRTGNESSPRIRHRFRSYWRIGSANAERGAEQG